MESGLLAEGVSLKCMPLAILVPVLAVAENKNSSHKAPLFFGLQLPLALQTIILAGIRITFVFAGITDVYYTRNHISTQDEKGLKTAVAALPVHWRVTAVSLS